MDEERMRREAEGIAKNLEMKGYKTSVRRSVIMNLVGEKKVKYSVLAVKGENVVRWNVGEEHYEVSIRLSKEVDEVEMESKGYIVEKDGEYTRLFKRSKKPFHFMNEVP